MSPVRVRQHVNPLSRKYQQPVSLPDWTQIYDNPQQPLHLDIGCARGRFLYELAPKQPDWNFLGLEIRQSLVDEANQWRDRDNLTNLHYLYCNINVMSEALLQSLPQGRLKRISIQFPDPWFKKRHHKRRVVQPELVEDLARFLAPDGEIFLQSDVEEVAREMCDRVWEHPAFTATTDDWLAENPLPVPTEREIATQNKGEPVYRRLFRRKPLTGS
ncbi:MAG: tRNA (guanosine(46)-N7)-methyltransferase TrmB [Phormidium sp. BM_Day4_Bin.17]|nr:tRNA (guanosine(46)-N7)-methyltransferase TrmB [Phormidium sp. BM_Day4_Bin.17]UCJ12885.1 MAG: tRNA (guanosine(46)-N7)-methyltransferase TrmB [Phormidium sp. PBR-2020]